MSVSVGNSEFCFPLDLNVSLGFALGNIEGLGGETKLAVSLKASHEVLIPSLLCRHLKQSTKELPLEFGVLLKKGWNVVSGT